LRDGLQSPRQSTEVSPGSSAKALEDAKTALASKLGLSGLPSTYEKVKAE
jgi:hypothetical protein